MRYVKRLSVCLAGLFLFGSGLYLNIKANIGLTPWSAFAMGVSNVSGLLYGDASLLIGLAIIAVDLALREKIGVGSVLNAVLVGKTVDLLEWLGLVSESGNVFLSVAMLLAGQLMVALGSYLYMSTELGCGPRDALMVALGKRLGRIPIGAVRGSLEAMAAFAGWLLGAKIGFGTVLAVAVIGLFIQMVFKLFRYDAKAAVHESFADTFKSMVKMRKPKG